MSDPEVFARCAHPTTAHCQSPQTVICPTWHEGKLANHCRWCHGELREMTREEFRALLDARNGFQGGTR